jgi:hypothetical protein
LHKALSLRAILRRIYFDKAASQPGFIQRKAFMKRLISSSLTLLITFLLLVATDRRAWGYVDPGSGLIALQTFASVGAAYAYFIRRRIRSFFSSEKKAPVEVMPAAAESAESREVA